MSLFWLKLVASIVFVLVPGFALRENFEKRPILTTIALAIGAIMLILTILPFLSRPAATPEAVVIEEPPPLKPSPITETGGSSESLEVDQLRTELAGLKKDIEENRNLASEQSSQNLCDLTGSWEGYATAGSVSLGYQWSIEQDSRDLYGTISLRRDSGDRWNTYEFQGSVFGTTVFFEGKEWLTNGNGGFCLASGQLEVEIEADCNVLVGTWGPNGNLGGCPAGSSGKVFLERR